MPKPITSFIPVDAFTEEFVEFVNYDWRTKHRKFSALGVYVVDLIGTPYCKVGSTGTPVSRLNALASSMPFNLEMPFFVTTCGGLSHIEIEKAAHCILEKFLVRREWFLCDKDDAISAVRKAVMDASKK